MSEANLDASKRLVRRLVEEVVDRRDPAAPGEVADGEPARRPRAWSDPFRGAFPDFRMEIVELIAEGDRVVAYFRCSGTHAGEWRNSRGSDGLVRRFRAVVGKPSTPTPLGLFAVYERARQPDPDAFLGPWALHLTAHSNVLEDYGGGPGRVALHGRSGASLRDPLGTAASHGCVRVRNGDIRWLAKVAAPGTPVLIER
jgi:L,D-transpeptidase catalytic domain/SnoaL-like polyketide cyclase